MLVKISSWQDILRHLRKCVSCNEIGDEIHYLLKYKLFEEDRKKVKPYHYSGPNVIKFQQLMINYNSPGYNKLCSLLKHNLKAL